MLTPLATALLAAPAPAAAPTSDLLLDLLPRDPAIAIRIGDLAGRIERPADERSAWEAYLADERFVALIELGLESAEFGDAEGIDALAILLEIGRFVEGGALAIPSLEPDAVVGVLRLREGYLDSWAGVLGHLGESFEPMAIGGLDAHVIGAGTGGVLALVEVGGLTVLAAGDEDRALDAARAQITALEDGPGEPGWWSDVPDRESADLMEAFIGFGALATESAELALMDGLLQGLYVGLGVGEGSEGTLALGALLYENDVAQRFADALGSADLSLASRIPRDADLVSVGSADVMGVIDAFAALVDSVDGDIEAAKMIDQGLAAGSEVIGIDIEEELLGNLTGDMLYAQWIDSLAALEEQDVMDDWIDALPVIAFGIDDPEPFLDLMDIAVGFLGGMEHDVLDSDLGAELVVTAPDDEGLTLRALVTDEWVVFGAHEGRVHGIASGPAEEGWLTEAEMRALEGDVASPGFTFARVPWVARLMLDALALEGELSGVPPEAYDATEALADHVPGTLAYGMSVSDRWFSLYLRTL